MPSIAGSRSGTVVVMLGVLLALAVAVPNGASAAPTGCATTGALGSCTYQATESPARVTGACRGLFVSPSIIAFVTCEFRVRLGSQVVARCEAELPVPVCTATSTVPIPAGSTLVCEPSTASSSSFALAVVCSSGV